MASTKTPTGYVIYRGSSLLDGAPIVVVALTGSSNRKTGNMVQTYILADGVDPVSASRTGQDAAVCGDCKHRPINGGACYVTLIHGPASVYRTLQRGGYPDVSDRWPTIGSLGAGRMVRLGTYGDPMAVPAVVWLTLTARAAGRTGYTHQWANAAIGDFQRTAIAGLCMASADNVEEARQAKAQGLRYFRIRRADESLRQGEFVCPASEEAGKRKTCATCGACDGSDRPGKASAVIIVHGSKASRFSAQPSL